MNPEYLIPMGRDYYPKGMRPATNEETVAQLEAEILRLRTTETAAAHALDALRQLLGLDLVPGEHPSVTRQRIEAVLAAARAEAGAYREALEFYATEHIFKPHVHGSAFDRRSDLHETARDTLARFATPAADPQVGKEVP